MDEEYLSSMEVAKILGCSKSYVTILVKQGFFPGTKKLNPSRLTSPLRIPRKAVEKYQEMQIVSPKPTLQI